MRNPSWTWTIQCASSFLGSSASTSNFAKLHFLDPHSTIIVETTINYFQPLFLLLNLTAIIISSNIIMCTIVFLVIFLLLLHNIFPVSVKTTLLEFVQNQFCPKWKLISSFRLSDLRPGRNPLLPHSEIHYRGHGLCSTLNPNQSYHPYTFVQGSFGKWRQGHSEKQRDVIDTIISQSFTYKHKLKTVHLCFSTECCLLLLDQQWTSQLNILKKRTALKLTNKIFTLIYN